MPLEGRSAFDEPCNNSVRRERDNTITVSLLRATRASPFQDPVPVRHMAFKPTLWSRRSVRLPTYDYQGPGAYFVTLCTWRRHQLFGRLLSGRVRPSTYGLIAHNTLQRIPGHFPSVRIDEFVIMPDHIHAIIIIDPPPRPNESSNTGRAPPIKTSTRRARGPASSSLGAIVGSYKSAVSREINRLRGTPGTRVWLRNYYERIIRTEDALHQVRRYIRDNPRRASERTGDADAQRQGDACVAPPDPRRDLR